MKNTIINLIWLICIGLILIIPRTMSINPIMLTKERIPYIINIFYSQIENHFKPQDREADKTNLADTFLNFRGVEEISETQFLGLVRDCMKVSRQECRPSSLTDQVLNSAYSNALNEI